MKTEAITFKNKSLNLEFRLSIIDYQSPQKKTGYSGNWLFVKYECHYKDKSYAVEHPSLLTTDLVRIYKWLSSISRNRIPEFVGLVFTEPNLQFEIYSHKAGVIRVGIELSYEAKPPFIIDEFCFGSTEDDDYDFLMIFECSYQELKVYRDLFKKLCGIYPIRGSLSEN